MTKIPALIVNQWLKEWDEVNFFPAPPRGKPKKHFYVLSMSAYKLKKLSGIYRRDPDKLPADDEGIQRRHDPERSAEILRYITDGFPLSRINPQRLVDRSEIPSLRMPGWIPGAVVANVLADTDERGPNRQMPAKSDLVTVEDGNEGLSTFLLPDGFEAEDWAPRIHPIEIIDGQHRLWALEESDSELGLWESNLNEELKSLEIPVVAFHGLDRTWQAYLFYTINQLPKKVDQSLVFDLYPLLRDQEWLERIEGPEVYRNSRAQDLVIVLWSHPESPWNGRILRHGGRIKGQVTQASFIRSLVASFIKTYDSGRIGGLFGAYRGTHDAELGWSREQQSAFLIVVWKQLSKAIVDSSDEWAKFLRKRAADDDVPDAKLPTIPFDGPDTLLATDQGCRVFMFIVNDVIKHYQDNGLIDISTFRWARRARENDEAAVTRAIEDMRKQIPKTLAIVQQLCSSLASFDWRVSSSLPPSSPERDRQASFRGSSGYKALRQYALIHVRDKAKKELSLVASELLTVLGYEEPE